MEASWWSEPRGAEGGRASQPNPSLSLSERPELLVEEGRKGEGAEWGENIGGAGGSEGGPGPGLGPGSISERDLR